MLLLLLLYGASALVFELELEVVSELLSELVSEFISEGLLLVIGSSEENGKSLSNEIGSLVISTIEEVSLSGAELTGTSTDDVAEDVKSELLSELEFGFELDDFLEEDFDDELSSSSSDEDDG